MLQCCVAQTTALIGDDVVVRHAERREGIDAVEVPLTVRRVIPMVDFEPDLGARRIAEATAMAVAFKSLLAETAPLIRDDVLLIRHPRPLEMEERPVARSPHTPAMPHLAERRG